MAESMEVKHIVNNDAAVKAIEKLVQGMQKLEKQSDRTSRTSKRGVDITSGSFAALEEKLRRNEAHLKKLELGSQSFTRQSRRVQQLRTRVDEWRRSMQGANTELQRAARGGGPAANLAGRFAAMAGSVVSIHTLQQGITKELQKQIDIRKKASQQEQTFEQALADVGLNIGGENIAEARRRIVKQAPVLGVTQQGFANLIGQATSAGAESLDEAFNLATLALKATVGDADKAANLMTSTLDVAKKAGTKDFEGVFGQILQTQQQVRGIDASTFFGNVGNALATGSVNMQNQDRLSSERIVELMASASQILVDAEGAKSSTAVSRLLQKMDEFVPERSAKARDGSRLRLSQEEIDAFRGTRDFDERVRLLKENETLRRQFVDPMKASDQKTFAYAFLSGETEQIQKKAEEGITSIAEARGRTQSLIDHLEAETVELRAIRRSEAIRDRGNVVGSRSLVGTAERVVETAVEGINEPGMDALNAFQRWADRTIRPAGGQAFGEDPVASIRVLRSQLEFLNRQSNDVDPFTRELQGQDREDIKEQIELLKMLEEQARRQTQLMENNQALQAPVEQPPPAALLGVQ